MPTQEPPQARGFVECGEDLTKYRIERWLAGLSRKTWLYLTRLESLSLVSEDDTAWTRHETEQAKHRLRTIEWLRQVNQQRKEV